MLICRAVRPCAPTSPPKWAGTGMDVKAKASGNRLQSVGAATTELESLEPRVLLSTGSADVHLMAPGQVAGAASDASDRFWWSGWQAEEGPVSAKAPDGAAAGSAA